MTSTQQFTFETEKKRRIVSRSNRRRKQLLIPLPTIKKEKNVFLTEQQKDAIRELYYTKYPHLSLTKFCDIAYKELKLAKLPKQPNMWHILRIPPTSHEDEQIESKESFDDYTDGASKRLKRKKQMQKRYEEFISKTKDKNANNQYPVSEKSNPQEQFTQTDVLFFPLNVVAQQINNMLRPTQSNSSIH